MVQEEQNNCNSIKRGISGNVLKWIAIVTMLIDHIGAVVLLRVVLAEMTQTGILNQGLYDLYNLLRGIGRLAFPIFCFLLVEGFCHTRSKGRYALRLGAFALLSEIPFDLAFNSKIWNLQYQNVFLTLLIAFLTMMAVDVVSRSAGKRREATGSVIWTVAEWTVSFMLVATGALVAEVCHTDYGAKGILCIMLLYILRNARMLQTVGGSVSFFWDGAAPLAFVPIALYNGMRGRQLKYVFYLFYPIHLLLLYLICVYMGISGFAAV